jgi:hypothetical protein
VGTHCLFSASCANFCVMVMVPVLTAAAVTASERRLPRAATPDAPNCARKLRAPDCSAARAAGTAEAHGTVARAAGAAALRTVARRKLAWQDIEEHARAHGALCTPTTKAYARSEG